MTREILYKEFRVEGSLTLSLEFTQYSSNEFQRFKSELVFRFKKWVKSMEKPKNDYIVKGCFKAVIPDECKMTESSGFNSCSIGLFSEKGESVVDLLVKGFIQEEL